MKDKHGREIRIFDLVQHDHGYSLVIQKDPDGHEYGKLVCEHGNSCEDIPYSIAGQSNELTIISRKVIDCAKVYIFDKTMENVVLIQKNRPESEKGFYHGIGGKIEHGETAEDAVVREVWEEAGVKINKDDLKLVCTVTGTLKPDGTYHFIHVFKMIHPDLSQFKTKTDERVEVISLKAMVDPRLVIVRSPWLLLMAKHGATAFNVKE